MKFLILFYSYVYVTDYISKNSMIHYSFNSKYIQYYLIVSFARSWMRRNSHVQFCSRDGIEKQPSTITPKEPDFVNNIEEE